jgi:16S rRNA (cytosine1402-N4)-methyltransferase
MHQQVIDYHIPVLLDESITGLNIRPDGIYVDATYGGGGHSAKILEKLKTGRLIAFDKDADAVVNFKEKKNFSLIHHDFIFMKNFLKELNALPVDGILADLGVSSHQFDSPERGFSYRFDTYLDMRMDNDSTITAAQIINEFPEYDLVNIFRNYGEINNAKQLARQIVIDRKVNPVETTFELIAVIDKCSIKGLTTNKYKGQVFQALRIAVNDELNALKTLLNNSLEVLKKHGILAIISYHSLEDRLVKNFMRTGNFEGRITKNIFGHAEYPFKLITKKPVIPSEREVFMNNRARSAKLRIAEKI